MGKINTKVFSKLLSESDEFLSRNEIIKADQYVDQALNALFNEEPSLRKWLESDVEFSRVLTANLSAMYSVIVHDIMHDRPLDVTMNRLKILVFRVACVAAFKADKREKEDIFG